VGVCSNEIEAEACEEDIKRLTDGSQAAAVRDTTTILVEHGWSNRRSPRRQLQRLVGRRSPRKEF
jgi:hypothetical protein